MNTAEVMGSLVTIGSAAHVALRSSRASLEDFLESPRRPAFSVQQFVALKIFEVLWDYWKKLMQKTNENDERSGRPGRVHHLDLCWANSCGH